MVSRKDDVWTAALALIGEHDIASLAAVAEPTQSATQSGLFWREAGSWPLEEPIALALKGTFEEGEEQVALKGAWGQGA